MGATTLRQMRADDLRWLVAMRSDRETMGPHNWVGPSNPALQCARLTGRLDCDGYVVADSGTLIVVDGHGTPAAGDVSWRTERWGPSAASACPAIGIALLPDHCGRGIGTDAQRCACSSCLRLSAYIACSPTPQPTTWPSNTAEQRALERAGFVRERWVRDAELRDGRHRDHIPHAVLRRERRDAPDEDFGIMQP